MTKTISFQRCARCGGDHESLTIRQFKGTMPVLEGGIMPQWWAPCPITGDPIFVVMEKHYPEDKPRDPGAGGVLRG